MAGAVAIRGRGKGYAAAAHGYSARRHLVLGFLSLAVLLGGVIGWGATASISESAIASGRVEAESRDRVVEHIDGGTVREVLVANGDRVTEGRVLIRLDDGRLRTEEAILATELAELVAERNRLEAELADAEAIGWDAELLAWAGKEGDACADGLPADAGCTIHAMLDGQRRLFEARRSSRAGLVAQLREQVTQSDRQVASLRSQARAVDRQMDFLHRELESYRDLFERRMIRLEDLTSREREAANLEGQAGDIESRIAGTQSRIAEIELQMLQIDAQRMERAGSEVREVQARENQIRERLTSVRESLERMEIRAPVAGEVFDMQVFAPAEVIKSGEPVLKILPEGASLVVRAEIDPIHIDQVWRGQEATVLFPAFSQRTTPMFGGRVLRVAADASEDLRTGLSWYEAEVEIGSAIEPERDLFARGWVRDAWDRSRDRVEKLASSSVAWHSGREQVPVRPRESPSGRVDRGMDAPPESGTGSAQVLAAEKFELAPGMPAEVYLRTGERSPLSYLVKPLTDYFSRALQEK